MASYFLIKLIEALKESDFVFDRTGVILYTLEYQKCADFYKNVLELPVMFEHEHLTCFDFGNRYLMVEFDDEYDGSTPTNGRIRTCLRMNVANVKVLADKLKAQNVEVNYQEHSWGTIAKFFDPDGNLCAFRDTGTFEKQYNDYRNDK